MYFLLMSNTIFFSNNYEADDTHNLLQEDPTAVPILQICTNIPDTKAAHFHVLYLVMFSHFCGFWKIYKYVPYFGLTQILYLLV